MVQVHMRCVDVLFLIIVLLMVLASFGLYPSVEAKALLWDEGGEAPNDNIHYVPPQVSTAYEAIQSAVSKALDFVSSLSRVGRAIMTGIMVVTSAVDTSTLAYMSSHETHMSKFDKIELSLDPKP